MDTKRMAIHPQSHLDVITNSSTELFVVEGRGYEDAVLETVHELWEEYLIDFPDDPDIQWVRDMGGASAFMPNQEYIARVGTIAGRKLVPGVVILELPINTPDGFIEKVGRVLDAPSETVG